MNKTPYKNIGDRLREIAIKKFGSVAELERLLKKSKGYLSQYIIGRNKPGRWLLNELRLMDVDINYIVEGKPSPAYTLKEETRNAVWDRLQYFAEKKFGSFYDMNKKLKVNMDKVDNVFFDRANSPIGFLQTLSEAGCDINWLLNGSPAAGIREPGVNYGAVEFRTAIDTLNERLDKLEKQNAGLIAITAAALEKLQEYDDEKDEAIRRLHVQFVSLLALNQINDLTKSGDNNIQ